MATKVSDLILDMETGDACLEDAYIASAKGKIAVSHAIFEAAYKNYELPDDGNFVCYQESADAGIPTKSDAAAGTACEAVVRELSAFYDAVAATAKKVKDAAEKDLKTLIAIGKKVGVNMSENFEGGFAEPLGKAVVTSHRLDLSDKQFLKGRKTTKLAKNYTKGMCYIMSAYGSSIAGDLNPSIKSFTGCDGGTKGVDSLKALESRLSDGGRALGGSVDTDRATDSVKAGDVTDLAMSVWTVANVADAVLKATKGGKKNADEMIRSFCSSDGKGGKISRTAEAINGDIKKYMANLEEIGNAIATGYTNSVYVLMQTVSK